MALLVQNYPRALIDLLSIKGQEPYVLSEQFQGVVDLVDIMVANRYQKESIATGSWDSNGDQLQLTVPEEEIWMVKFVSGTITTAVGDNVQTRLDFKPNRSNNVVIEHTPLEAISVSGQAQFLSYAPTKPLIMTAGDQLQMTGQVVDVAAARAASLSVVFARFGPGSQ